MTAFPKLRLHWWLALAGAAATPFVFGQAIPAAPEGRASVLGKAPVAGTAAAVDAEVEKLLGQMSRSEKLNMMSGTGGWDIKPLSRLGLPQIYGTDGPMGIRLSSPVGTYYPATQMLTATWNTDRARAFGEAIAREGKAGGFQNVLAPGMNLNRIGLGGRQAEYGSGEDPYLGAVLMPQVINGIQSQGMWATVKHLVVNDFETNRFNIDVQVDQRTLREIYLPAFEASVKSGQPANIMCAFNRINGEYACESKSLLTDIVKGDWAFNGFIESDYNAVKDGVKGALAGTDIDMPKGTAMNAQTLGAALDNGQLPPELLDDKVRRILRQELRFDFRSGESTPKNSKMPRDEAAEQAGLDTAREGIVLLSNRDKTLPLAGDRPLRIAVVGQRAQGDPPKVYGSAYFESNRWVSIVDGLKADAPAGSTVDVIDAMNLDPSKASSVAGFSGRYFTNNSLSGTPAVTRADDHIDFNWAAGDKAYSSIEWTGDILPTVTGDHVFKVRADGAVQIYVNDQLIADNGAGKPIVPTIPPVIPVYGKVALTAGTPAKVRIRYARQSGYIPALGGLTGVQFSWASLAPPAGLEAYDAVVVTAGLGNEYEGEGFDRPFEMPEFQSQMIASVATANPRTVALIAAGGPVNLQPFADKVGSLLYIWYPGQSGGEAVGDVLFGKVNPSGKLPVTMDARIEDNPAYAGFPKPNDPNATQVVYSEGVFVGYRGYERSGTKPLFAFGHGLSYTQFSYANVSMTTRPMSCSVAGGSVGQGRSVVAVLKALGTLQDPRATSASGMLWAAFLPSLLLLGMGVRRRSSRTALQAAVLALLAAGVLVGCGGGGDNGDGNGNGGDGGGPATPPVAELQVPAQQLVDVSFDLTNSGGVAGAEVAQVYVGAEQPAVERPIKELKGFSKVSLAPGETKRVTVTLNPRAFARWDTTQNDWVVDPGRYIVSVGGASDAIAISGGLQHDQERLSAKASAPTTLKPEGDAPTGLCFE